ncbi:MAG: hypothetical protein PHW21_07340, partial [Candidatus Izemoplasmatales bacterium]|nr:hypothetical protein [Candidatus Izemoplasmatales bacterium]
MLNDIIKIDLHIHSVFSEYKDGAIVQNSTLENIDTLLNGLETNNIRLCAITDHNRFDYNLYKSLNDKIAEKDNSIVKNNLPGVEFNVILEEDKPKCHIVAIFNDADQEKVKEIENKIFSVRKLETSDDAYSIKEFEEILKVISIEVILIVHQKQALDNTQGDTDSLSNATENPSQFIKIGYIDSLEYNYPRVEGIVKNSLRKVDLDFPIITGSDCHTWENYPFHSSPNGKERDFTSFKCLPTFKGLLMSITSFNSRVNRIHNENEYFIKSININDVEYPLANGLNAIIGDNGSGKSLLLNLIASGDKRYYASLIEENKIKYNSNAETFQKEYINYIEQGAINKKVRDGNLFDNGDTKYYDDIENKDIFAQKIKKYFNDLISYVNHQILVAETREKLDIKILEIIPVDKNFYHPIIKSEISTENTEEDKKRKNALNQIYANLKLELESNEEYYKALNIYDRLKNNLDDFNNILEIVNQNFKIKNNRNVVRNLIKKHLDNYKTEIDTKRTSEETER